MKSSEQNGRPAPSSDADAVTPFFARFLEDQHGGDDVEKAPAQFMTLKYPSDRDEIDDYSSIYAADAPTKAEPSGRTLKYPSDRDEIDWYVAPRENAADAR
ncbi:MAG TPA: microviridin/marinostatin family tricyclic proteinase inhibitor [Pyrinomonadaceae bacterium]